jgi:NAD(P)H-dependent nitrite reductase small subunit
MGFVKAADLGSIPSGEGIVLEIEGKRIALFHCDGTYYATDNTCAHRGGPLGEGLVEGTKVVCPWHGWEFDVSSGTCLNNPKAKIATYPTRVEGESVLVDVGGGS